MKKKYNESYDNAIGPEVAGESLKDNNGYTAYRIQALCLIILGFLAALQAATQWFAAQMGYNAMLGDGVSPGSHFYAFYKIIEWKRFAATYTDEYQKAWTMCMSAFMPFMVIIAVLKFQLQNKLKGDAYLHGSARWANRADIEKMGLLSRAPSFKQKFSNAISYIPGINRKFGKKLRITQQEGVFVGAWQDRKTKEKFYLRHNGPEHVLCVAPTRSGKGVGLVNPTLLTWKESCFVMDLKGELWALTSGWRKNYAHNKCIRFEPACPRECIDKEKDLYNVARWNPFDEIRSEGSIEYYYDHKEKKIKQRICSGLQEVADVQNIITLLVDPKGEGLKTHWEKTAFALLVGCVIHLKHNDPEHCNLHQLDMMISGLVNTAAMRKKADKTNDDLDEFDGFFDGEDDSESDWDQKKLWEDMKLGLDRDGKTYKARDAVITAATDMINRPKDEGGSVLSTANSFLNLYRDNVLSENLSVSDFRIKQLMNMDDPVSLYVVTQPSDKQRIQPLVRLMVNLVLRLLADKMEFEDGRSVKGYAHKLLLMLDEFPSLGKLEIMQESLAFVAGYGMKCYLIVQDMAQLYSLYGKDESISSNCHVQNFYASQNKDTCQLISERCGTTTILHENISLSGTGLKTSRSKSMQETSRPLLTIDEIMHLPGPKKDANGNVVEPGKMLITVAGFPAIYGIQPLYFQDPVLLDRAKVHAPLDSDILLKNGKIVGLEITDAPANEQKQFAITNPQQQQNLSNSESKQAENSVHNNQKVNNNASEPVVIIPPVKADNKKAKKSKEFNPFEK